MAAAWGREAEESISTSRTPSRSRERTGSRRSTAIFLRWRADHGRGCLQPADADLPRGPLHDGWPLGELRTDVKPSGTLRPRRANFSDHGADRLGASASCRVSRMDTSSCRSPSPTGSQVKPGAPATDHAEFRRCEGGRGRSCVFAGCAREEDGRSSSTASWGSHVGKAPWQRTRAGLESAIERIRELRAQFWRPSTSRGRTPISTSHWSGPTAWLTSWSLGSYRAGCPRTRGELRGTSDRAPDDRRRGPPR